ncbi:MAG: hypothetical protein AAFO91_00375 [Bacteroidota bacterium]
MSKRFDDILETKTSNFMSTNKQIDSEIEAPKERRSFRVFLLYLVEQTKIFRVLEIINNLICLLTYLIYVMLTYFQHRQYKSTVFETLSVLRVLPSAQ